MISLTSRVTIWIFGLFAIGGLALFLTLFQSSPGPLAAPHTKAVPGSFIWSCKKCHADDGMDAGCLSCHDEISVQLDQDNGFHAYLWKQSAASCGKCHPEHLGTGFPLISEVSWQGMDTNRFSHPHVEFTLTGRHDELVCAKCHTDQFREPMALTAFPGEHRSATMLGLSQECISCHQDIHGSGEKTQDCTQCHNQEAFKPAPFFNHDQYYVLEGPHATAACASCHQQDIEAAPGKFGPVKGKTCVDCHTSPHRFEPAPQSDCLACHQAADEKWSMGQRGIDAVNHSRFGFELAGAHVKVECSKCHYPGLETYRERFPDPYLPGYARRAEQCSGCHQDPHAGQFKDRHASCAECHTVDRFLPATLGPTQHPASYPLLGRHLAVACVQCHQFDEDRNIRQFKDTTKSCKACHNNPHGSQFDKEIRQHDCIACHKADFSTFKIREYQHQNMRAFFLGKGHGQAVCIQCHEGPAEKQQIVQYRETPADCASCHADIHRGQFLRLGQNQCERCHASYDQWSADSFNHERDSVFQLGKAHEKVACKTCHLSAPQWDGQSVVQYHPLTTKCEDCHVFQKQ